jgi:glycosyltransferase involved in cell wall biosynthesis
VTKRIDERGYTIGFFGTLAEAKGVLNFVEVIPKIVERANKLTFAIIGIGPLYERIKRYLDEEHLNGKVRMDGRIRHENLP